jgi:hypothetical protein
MGATRSDAWLQSVMQGTVRPVEPRFMVGDVVDVLRAARLPAVEEVVGTGIVERITESESGEPLHWVSGFPCARSVREIRLVRRGNLHALTPIPIDNHLLINPRKTLGEMWAEEDEERRGEE